MSNLYVGAEITYHIHLNDKYVIQRFDDNFFLLNHHLFSIRNIMAVSFCGAREDGIIIRMRERICVMVTYPPNRAQTIMCKLLDTIQTEEALKRKERLEKKNERRRVRQFEARRIARMANKSHIPPVNDPGNTMQAPIPITVLDQPPSPIQPLNLDFGYDTLFEPRLE